MTTSRRTAIDCGITILLIMEMMCSAALSQAIRKPASRPTSEPATAAVSRPIRATVMYQGEEGTIAMLASEIEKEQRYRMRHQPDWPPAGLNPKRLLPLLVSQIDDRKNDPNRAIMAYVIYRRIAGEDPPNVNRLDDVGDFVIEFGSLNAVNQELAEEFKQLIPPGASVRMAAGGSGRFASRGVAIIHGLGAWRAIEKSLNRSARIRWDGTLVPVPADRLKDQRLLAIPLVSGSATRPANAPTYDQAFRELYDTLGRKYPNFRMKSIDWDKVGRELLPLAGKVKNDEEFGLLCMRLVARLEDSHAVLANGSARVPRVAFPEWDPGLACLIDDRGRPVIFHIDPGGPAEKAGVKPGMTVLSVNGIPAEQALVDWMKLASTYFGYSSERCLRHDAARQFFRQKDRGASVKLELEDPAGKRLGLDLPADVGVRYLPRLPVPIAGIRDSADISWTKLGDNIGYIYVRRIRDGLPEMLDKAIGELGGVRGLIIDVRGNTGGGFDAARALRNFDAADPAEPNRPRYKGPIALLIDERCISAGEGWASWFIAKKRARVFGSTTAGASSRKENYTLINDLYTVVIPVKAYTGFLDRPIERRGLEPDVPVRCNAKDLAAGRDTVLETAKKHLVDNP